MKNYNPKLKISLLLLLFLLVNTFLINSYWVPVTGIISAVFNSVQVQQSVNNCNNDGNCDSWENSSSCPDDCAVPGQPTCNNNGICESGENPGICPGDCPRGGGGGGGGGPLAAKTTIPLISDLNIRTDTDFAEIFWKTSEHALSGLYWGKTLDYKDGSSSETLFLKNHALKIENLFSDTEYFFKIAVIDSFGNENKLDGMNFRTLTLPDTEPPSNVKNLKAESLENSIMLSWENPIEEDFEIVKVMKWEKFYPKDPLEGRFVYDGSGTGVKDKKVEKDTVYYYSVFSRDKNENYSSGAVVSAQISELKEIKEKIEEIEVIEEMEDISFYDFYFIQDGKEISFVEDKVKIDANKSLKISIYYEKVPGISKKIIITMQDPKDPNKTFSFMLKPNKKKTAYEANISSLGKEEIYPLSINFFDYKNRGLKKIEGELFSTLTERAQAEKEAFWRKFFLDIILAVILVAIVGGVIFFTVFK